MLLISKEDAYVSIDNLFAPTPAHQDMKEDCLEVIDNLPTVLKPGEITFEQFREYCEKRCLVVVTKEFFLGAQDIGKVKVVRCKECAHWDRSWYTNDGNHYCPVIDKATKGDWFCADGEKESKWN